MAEAVPASIVAGLEQLGEQLAHWVRAHRDASLATPEDGVLAAVREVLSALLEAVVQESTTALAPEQQRLRAVSGLRDAHNGAAAVAAANGDHAVRPAAV